ncbi:unnamed protein product [Rhizoctonia solani]|uniref:Protein kinase domain-containing protein n=1 Tax=Rhizoctonia solani TaxID=456999 RepID=A0A8H2XVM0_9AGAM|nr:unnamed protein product [Rhizoctonia solani]CAE6437114.1 unnamed protein product [Rhizoctonia solani]
MDPDQPVSRTSRPSSTPSTYYTAHSIRAYFSGSQTEAPPPPPFPVIQFQHIPGLGSLGETPSLIEPDPSGQSAVIRSPATLLQVQRRPLVDYAPIGNLSNFQINGTSHEQEPRSTKLAGVGSLLSNPITTSIAQENHRTMVGETSGGTDLVQSSQMTSLDVYQRLVKHGCKDLTQLIDPKKYSSCRVAEGAFGDVWKGELEDGTPVAVKVLRFALVADNGGKNLKRMVREIYTWSKLDHENVHKLLGVTIMEGRLGMVSRWMPEGNLRDYLDRQTCLDRYELCVQIAQGVEYIHSKGMVHGDIKASNILVSSEGVLKLTDFDHSLITDCSLLFTATTRIGGGTPRWMAPELFEHESSHQRTKRTDIYALGMVINLRDYNI